MLAKAGIQTPSSRKRGTTERSWIPAYAGMTPRGPMMKRCNFEMGSS
jgi:hypothetical protein